MSTNDRALPLSQSMNGRTGMGMPMDISGLYSSPHSIAIIERRLHLDLLPACGRG
jgi:hypothetical protein